MLTREQIKTKAMELLVNTGLIGIYPTRVEMIAEEFFGYKCVGFKPSADTQNVSGAVYHDQQVLYFNSSETLQRQIFTVAHELGHIVLHRTHGNQVDYRISMALENEYKNSPELVIEKEANMFAAELLMPEEDFRKVYKKMGGNIDRISEVFGTSRIATSIRAKKLGDCLI